MERQRHTIKILPPDPKAPEAFEDLRRFIECASPVRVRVEHVGSTAIEGVAGKGIIDAMVVTGEGECDPVQRALTEAGLDQNRSSHPDPDRWYASGTSVRPNGRRMHVHVHITYTGSACEVDHLAFRDYLRGHHREAASYARLKHEWRAAAGNDRVLFTELKTPYVTSVLTKAKEEIRTLQGET